MPPGNLSPRYPYSTWRTYYYDRPYNADHVAKAQTETPSHPLSPYDNRGMEDAARKVEQQALARHRPNLESDASMNDSLDSLRQDGYLEFTDWQKYRAQRLRWEHASEETLPFTDPAPKASSR